MNNKLFLVCDTIKEELKHAYKSRCKIQMLDSISTIIKICKGTGYTRLLWFARLLSNHIKGIITHTIYKVTNGKVLIILSWVLEQDFYLVRPQCILIIMLCLLHYFLNSDKSNISYTLLFPEYVRSISYYFSNLQPPLRSSPQQT